MDAPTGEIMETYEVDLYSRPRLRDKVLAVACFGGLFAALVFCADFFWRAPDVAQKPLSSIAIWDGLQGLLWGIGMVFIFSPKTSLKYKLMVDEVSMSGEQATGWFRIRKAVRKGMIRSIFPVNGRFGASSGVGVSERSRFGARMLGWVFLPNTLPEFERLRTLAENWRVSGITTK